MSGLRRSLKIRLDAKVSSDLEVSRTKAAGLIVAGTVRQAERRLIKPGQLVAGDAVLEYVQAAAAVSRAGDKLGGALDTWQVGCQGLVALDVGASTGGFTQALLNRGAKKVVAVDVGTGQLDWSLRNDPRVVSLERTDIRRLASTPEPVDMVTIDVSFISLKAVLPAVTGLVPAGTTVICLFKPQFEVGKVIADKNRGVITDQSAVDNAQNTFTEWLGAAGWLNHQILPASVPGTHGNQEYLYRLSCPQ